MGKYVTLIQVILMLTLLPAYGHLEQAQEIFNHHLEEGDAQSDSIKNKLSTMNMPNDEAVHYVQNIKKPKVSQAQLGVNLSPKAEHIDTQPYVKPEDNTEAYALEDMGDSLTHFAAMKAISDPMQDDLGGIGQHANPTVMQGKCQRCTVKLGSAFQDCCNLKGIAEGLFGGCKSEEKQLANATLKDKRCVLVQQKYCSKKKLKVCVEKKSAYCCYGSQMGKVIQEIAHHQLNLPWGDGENPNCTSLTAAQLSQLDFNAPYARAKLADLVSEFQSVGARNASNHNISNQISALQNKLSQQYKKSGREARK